MKKIYLLALPALLLSSQAIGVEHDSVYTWGAWAQGIKPAAGPVASVTPAPAQKTDINFRPNENDAFLREATNIPAPDIGNADPTQPIVVAPPTQVIPPPPPPPPAS